MTPDAGRAREAGTRLWPAGPDGRILLALIGLWLVMRLPHLAQPLTDAFAWREASTAMMAGNIPGNGWNFLYPEVDWTGPGPGYQGRELQVFTLVVAALSQFVGWHDGTGRLVALLFGLPALIFLHRLVALAWGERHAHAAALVQALMPAAIMIETSYLPDAAMLGLALPGLFWLTRFALSGGRVPVVAGTLLFTLGILTKPSGAGLFAVPLGLAFSAARRGQGRRGQGRRALVLVLAGLAGLVALGLSLRWALYLGSHYPPYHVAGQGYLWQDGLASFVDRGFYLDRFAQLATGWFYGLPILILLLAGLVPGRRRGPAGWLPGAALAGCALVFLVSAREVTQNMWNLHALSLGIAAFAGRGGLRLAGLAGAVRRPALSGFVAGLLVAVTLLFSTLPLVRFMKTDFSRPSRLLGLAIGQLAGPGDLVITLAKLAGSPTALYYAGRKGWLFPPVTPDRDWSRFGADGPEAIASLEGLRRQGAVWFGYLRQARDGRGELFAAHYPALIRHLEATAEKRLDRDGMVIFRLAP